MAVTWKKFAYDGESPGSSTYVIAAADTPAVLKARADAVCDGTNLTGGDEAEINAAIAIAASVSLCEGTYWLSGSIIMDSSQSLIGSGIATVLKIMDSSDSVHCITNSDQDLGNDNILVKDLSIDGNKVASGSGSAIFFKYVGKTAAGLGFTIDNCLVKNFSSDEWAIDIYGCFNGVVSKCVVQNCDCEGILIDIASENCRVVACQVYNSSIAAGISLDNATVGCLIENCTVNGCYYGIWVEGSKNNVTGNIIRLSDRHGIAVSASTDCIISANTITENSQATDATYDGIWVSASDYCKIFGNQVRKGALANQHRYGINVSNGTCDGCTVEGNDLYTSGDTGDLNDAGTNTRKRNNIGNDGAWIAGQEYVNLFEGAPTEDLATKAPTSEWAFDHNARDATAAVQGHATAAQITKLDGIEAAADVTDATNVAAAGAVMDADYTSDGKMLVGTGAGTHAALTIMPAIVTDTVAANAVTIDWTAGLIHKVTIDQNTTFTFTDPSKPSHCTLILIHDGNDRTTTWTGGSLDVEWLGLGALASMGASYAAGKRHVGTFVFTGTAHDYVGQYGLSSETL